MSKLWLEQDMTSVTLAHDLPFQREPPLAGAVHVKVATDPAVGTVIVLFLENLENWNNLRKMY